MRPGRPSTALASASTVFMSGCLLRCLYCHNPDTWHLKDGTRVSFERAKTALAGLCRAAAGHGWGIDDFRRGAAGPDCISPSGSSRPPRAWSLHTALDTSGFLGARADDEYLRYVDLVLLDIKSWDPETYRRAVGQDIRPTIQFAERLAALGKPVWVRFVLVPGLTDDPANVEGIARFVAPMRNVEWVEVLPFHQMGTFKWKAMGLNYELSDTQSPSPDLMARVIGQFQDAGCRAR